MMKRLLVITLLLFVCVGVAAAEQVELVWYHCCGQVERNVIFDKWAREFEAQNPVKS